MRSLQALVDICRRMLGAVAGTYFFLLVGVSLVTVMVKFITGSFWAAWIIGCSLSFLGLYCLYQPRLLLSIGVIGDLLEGLRLISGERGAIEGIGSLPLAEYFTMAIRLAIFSITALFVLAWFPQSGWSFLAYFVLMVIVFHLVARDPSLKSYKNYTWVVNMGVCGVLLLILLYNASPQFRATFPIGSFFGFMHDKQVAEVISEGKEVEDLTHQQEVLADVKQIRDKLTDREELTAEEAGYWAAVKAGRNWTMEEYRQKKDQWWRVPFWAWALAVPLLIWFIFFNGRRGFSLSITRGSSWRWMKNILRYGLIMASLLVVGWMIFHFISNDQEGGAHHVLSSSTVVREATVQGDGEVVFNSTSGMIEILEGSLIIPPGGEVVGATVYLAGNSFFPNETFQNPQKFPVVVQFLDADWGTPGQIALRGHTTESGESMKIKYREASRMRRLYMGLMRHFR